MKVSQDVHVVLSLGPQNVMIPAVVGESLRVARIQLLQSGLQMGEVTSFFLPTAEADSVLQQTPASGTRAASPRVDLLVAGSAPEPSYVMPWLVGMPLIDADHMLSTGGLKLSKTTFAVSPQWPKGTVIQQIPEQGSRINADTTIEMVVSQ
jgi:serine/threonine-protein kinase